MKDKLISGGAPVPQASPLSSSSSASASYVSGASAVPLLGETLGDNLRRAAERCGDNQALVAPAQGYRASYHELYEQTGALARALLACGIQRGDKVGIWSPNCFEWVVAQYATARVGAVLVNLNPAYKTAELRYALLQSGVRLLLLAKNFRQSDYVQMLQQVRDECPQLQQTYVLPDDWAALLARADAIGPSDLSAREATLQFDDPINIQYTSGTTGFPKGATLSHHNLLNNGFFIGETLRYTQADRVCIPVPFYHCFGMVIGNLACVSHGATIVIPGPAFDPLTVMETVQNERCTSLYGVPTMFIGILDHPRCGEFDFSSLRTGVMAGSPCPVEVMKKVQSRLHMPEVTICYGMTETSPVSTQTSPFDPLDKRVGSVGRVHPHLELKVIDPVTFAIVPRGQAGELCTRGYSVMLGYHGNSEATCAAIDAGRWMHTGDLATIDGEGYVNIVGRIKDMIIRGGENIYPREIEEFLHTHPAVSEAQVLGVPSRKYGEEVMAWVKVRPGAELVESELAAFCKNQIATYKIPRYWKFVDSFPLTVTGKVQKFRMREIAIDELGLSEAAAVKTA